MAAARTRAVAAACCAAATLAILVLGPADQARSQATDPQPSPPTAATSPLAGDGMWIWYVSKAQRGNVNAIAAKARRRGIETVLIKSGDAGRYWSQFSASLVAALKARGLDVCGWQFVYGRKPKAEANVGAAAVARGADCLVIDAEGHYEGRYPQASTYMLRLRNLIGPEFAVALAAFPYVDYHPAFPYSVFLGPGGAQYNLPQLYWKTIGESVDEAFTHTYVFNRAYGREILPIGQVYLNPSPRSVRRFRRLALSTGMAGVSWWSWQHAGKRQWKAVGGNVSAIAGYLPYNSYPLLRQGSKGDLVAWAQQLLAGGGNYTPISGYFEAPTRSAVLAFQSARLLPQTGNIDVPTWDALLQNEPLRVRWTKSGAVAAAGAGDALPAPRSARLPARRNEIAGHRLRR
ncbi:MAG TPA: peptidoglycan-binding domain-containing protein [Solirubrobacterales bacterium]|nr:peptidoglycan-binding domain-containing protein [Solirubrobacterales bacterium]